MTIINKFGGEIIGNPRLAKLAVKRIEEQIRRNQKPVVVVSALAGVTDKLIKLSMLNFTTPAAPDIAFGEVKGGRVAKLRRSLVSKLLECHLDWAERFNINNRPLKNEFKDLEQWLENPGPNRFAFQDKVLSHGEKFSSLLFAELLNKQGIPAVRLTGEELGIITDENFGNAGIERKESLKNIRAKLKNISQVPVITGFIGKTPKGKTTTLGRGGSDTTACLVGAALSPLKIILWKNVPGVLSADPKMVKGPKLVKFLNYEEAEESGKVIHDKAIDLVKRKGLGIEVAYIINPEQKTEVGEKSNAHTKNGVKIISLKGNLQLFTISSEKITRYGALYEIANIISREGINMVLIRNTKESLYIVIEKNERSLAVCRKKIEALGYQVLAKKVAMVNAVGSMDWKIAERFNRLLYEVCPETDLGSFPYRNCHRLEAVVEISKVKKLINKFHKEFIEKI